MTPNTDNIQSLFITRYRHPLRAVLLFRITDPAAARGFLRDWAGSVNGGLEPPGSYTDNAGGSLEPVYHFAFNWPGTALLLAARNGAGDGLDPEEVGTNLESFFTKPENAPHSRSVTVSLDMLDANAPEHWWEGSADPSAFHIAMVCYFADDAQKSDELARVRTTAASAGLEEWQFQSFEDGALSGYVPDQGILHFGFRDGVSKINIDWEDTGVAGKVNFRELLLGYPSDSYKVSPTNPGPWQDFVRDGTYLNLSWLYQDVAAFNSYLKEQRTAAAPHSGAADPEEWLAAKMMGRWRNGSAMALYPDTMPQPWDASDRFGYADDDAGLKTPLFSHVRVCNPRDQGLTHANNVRFPNGPPRLIRRGFSYGPPLEGTQDDGLDRGLIGLFACARINEQFYSVVRWIQKTSFSDQFDAIRRGRKRQDMMFGFRGKRNAETTTHIPVDATGTTALKLPLKDFIRYKGLAVFFVPSLKALSYLAG